MTHNLLAGKRGIVFGALNEDSIAWKVAVKAVEEGATITLSNTPMALRIDIIYHKWFCFFHHILLFVKSCTISVA